MIRIQEGIKLGGAICRAIRTKRMAKARAEARARIAERRRIVAEINAGTWRGNK